MATGVAHVSLLHAMNDPGEAISPMCLFLQSINGEATSSSAQLISSASSSNANNVWHDQGFPGQHSHSTSHAIQPQLSPSLLPTGHALPAQYSPLMQPTGSAFQPQLNWPAQSFGHAPCSWQDSQFQPQQLQQMTAPHLRQRVACPHPETADRQWRQRRQKRGSSGAAPTTRQGVEQIKRTELAKVRQQEALLEAQLRRMREESKEKKLQEVGLTTAVVEPSNSFKDFLKAEYEEGGYMRTF